MVDAITLEEPRSPEEEHRFPCPQCGADLRFDADSGQITVYFDDMETPHMQVSDKTFGRGRIGIGSFDDLNEFDDLVLRGN